MKSSIISESNKFDLNSAAVHAHGGCKVVVSGYKKLSFLLTEPKKKCTPPTYFTKLHYNVTFLALKK